jgi:hypothetical protein
MMVCSVVCLISISFSALHLHFIHDIINDIGTISVISNMICTLMLCLFNFPKYVDCNVGYQIPIS